MKKILAFILAACMMLGITACGKPAPAQSETAEAQPETPQVEAVNLYHVEEDGKYGFIDKEGNMVITPQFDDAWYMVDGIAPVCLNGKWGYINATGSFINENRYDYAKGFEGDFAAVKVNDKWGFVDKGGNMVVKPVYDEVCDFEGELAAVRIDDKWGFVDKTGAEIVKNKYDEVDGFENGMAAVCVDNMWGYIDASGAEKIEPQFDVAAPFTDEGYAIVIGGAGDEFADEDDDEDEDEDEDENKDGKLPDSVQKVKPDGKSEPAYVQDVLAYDEIYALRDLVDYVQNSKYGKYIEIATRLAFKKSYQDIEGIVGQTALVKQDGKWGIIGVDGSEIIEPKYDEMKLLEDGLAWVLSDDGWYLMDPEVPGRYINEGTPLEDAYAFDRDLAYVKLSTGNWGYMNKEGKIVYPKEEPVIEEQPVEETPEIEEE